MTDGAVREQRVLAEASISPAQLAHIVFRTNQLQAMVDWYLNVLRARVAYRNEKIAFLAYDDEHHRIAFVASDQYAEKPGGIRVGFYHAAFSFKTIGDLLGTYLRLKGDRVLPYRTICHGPTLSFYYRDPDANEIEFQVDAFDTPQEAEAWMAQAQFAANPIGIDVDAEDLVSRYRNGEPEAQLLRRADRI